MTSTPADLAALLAALKEPAERCRYYHVRGAAVCGAAMCSRQEWCEACLARAAWEAGLPLARLALADLLEEDWPEEGWEAVAHRLLLGACPRSVDRPADGSAVEFSEGYLRVNGVPRAGHAWVWNPGPAGWCLGSRRIPPEVRAAALAAALAALRAGCG